MLAREWLTVASDRLELGSGGLGSRVLRTNRIAAKLRHT